MTLQRVKSVQREALGGVFSLGYLDLATCAFFHLDGNGSHHSLTGKLVETRLTMIEHIPLTVDFADATVRIAGNIGRGNGVTLGVNVTGTSVNDSTAIGPWTQGMVAVSIGQRIVGRGQPEFALFRKTTVDEHVLVLDLADAGSLEETEYTRLLESGYHVADHLRTRLDSCHCGGIKLGTVRLTEAPVTIDASVIVHKYCRVKT